MAEMHTIFDRASKRCISLSKRSTLLLINGIYEKDYPLDSEVEYHWTEHHDDELKKTLADTIITIDHRDSYHLEIQMYPDEEIVLRVFEYGYRHALTTRDGTEVLIFPEPKILYLYEDGGAPDVQKLEIRFGSQGSFTYEVPTVKYLKMSMDELNRRKLIVLIPFQLLRLRKAIEKERTEENLEQLKNLIFHDIIGTIEANVSAGNITMSVGRKLKRITLQLYRHIYEKYDEMEKAGVNAMVEEALVLDIDIIEAEHRKDIHRLEAEHEQKVEQLESAHEQKIEQLEAAHEQQVEQLEAAHEQQVEQLEAAHEQQVEQLEAAHEQQVEQLVATHKQQLAEEKADLTIQMAGKLLQMGMDISQICEVTGLTPDEVHRVS